MSEDFDDELDNILNPKNEFYSKYFLNGFPDQEDIKNYYKIHFNNETVQNISVCFGDNFTYFDENSTA